MLRLVSTLDWDGDATSREAEFTDNSDTVGELFEHDTDTASRLSIF